MINARVAELLREPAKIQPEDLRNIAVEIDRFPYAQSLRALQLYGIHKFEPSKYNAQLSETAAYTANKKNLYQLINGAIMLNEEKKEANQVTSKELVDDNLSQPPQQEVVKSHFNIDNHPGMKRFEKPEQVFVNGKLNRILFKGEENFMNETTPVIDIEVTKESGKLVVQPVVEPVHLITPETAAEDVRAEDAVYPELNLKTEPTPEIHEDDSQLSFHRTEDFLPKVEFKTGGNAQQPTGNQQPKENKTNRHEEEMQRLIAEVEAKMKTAKAERQNKKVKDEFPASSEINFAETATFSVSADSSIAPVYVPEPFEVKAPSQKIPAEEWKPMSLSFAAPDAVSQKDALKSNPDGEDNREVASAPVEDRPVINLSFFSQELLPVEERKTPPDTTSNIPQFVNTWQNWLKIGKKEEPATPENWVEGAESQTPADEIKSAVIEKFIENEPKISRFNEDSTFTVRERGDDISHLMTETLANLYVEQRLYTKAIRAFGLLSEKHPDRADRYKGRIEEIKALRQK